MISNQSYCFSGIATLYSFFFLVSLFLHTLASPMLHYCRHDQRDALLDFKHEFPVNESNSSPYLSSWNKTSDCCFWRGVTCDAKSGEVISLDLSFSPFNNSLNPNSGLFKLHHLRNLTLANCYLYGEIPSSLGNLSHLTHLDLSENYLVGEVMALVGNLTQLRYLSLSSNKFSGNIPVSFANLTKLSYLDISENQFESTLPRDMSRFHNLEEFYVGGNSFSGSFPTSLFMNPSLTWVVLTRNQFKGPIEFSNTSSSSKLQGLYLSHNKFDGPIPKSISKFSNLEHLFLGSNSFTGSVPTFLSKLVNLEILDLSHNNLVGPIPRSNIVKLKSLDLSNNKLEGEIPGWLAGLSASMLSGNSFKSFAKSFEVSDLTQIILLDLSSNSFRGPLPSWICKLRSLDLLDLSNNSFNGSIPQCFKNIVVDLRTLNMQNNDFSGILLPEIFVNATRLIRVDVSGNKFEGKLPESLINSRYLEILNVRSNRFKDKFPSWLSSLPSLNVLIIRSNEFYGPLYDHPNVSIGFQSLKVIDISHNDLNGTLPPFYFSNWREMTTLSKDISTGMYMENPGFSGGYYLPSMEMVNKGVDTKFEQILKDFRAIDFSGNNFVGEIPKSIGLLKGLRLLNLSGNAFTSNIPQSLANLKNLEALDLSRNQLSGQIPPDLGSLSFLSTMNFSHNNLQGPIPKGTQFQRQNCSAFMDNPRLNGLEDICGETHVPDPTPQETEDLSEPEEQQVISWIAAAIAYAPGVFCGFVIGHIFFTQKHEWFMEMFRPSN
ncbi:receptor like protein 30 [Eutrema salsugineum]|nr:receptor like protein 30 [Eutrema salsugineum]